MLQPLGDSEDELQIAVETSKQVSFDGARDAMQQECVEGRAREEKAARRQRVREEMKTAAAAGRQIHLDEDAPTARRQKRSTANDEAAIVLSSDDDDDEVQLVKVQHQQRTQRSEHHDVRPPTACMRQETMQWPEWSKEGQCKGMTTRGYPCQVHQSSQHADAEPLRRGERYCRHHLWQGRSTKQHCK